MKQLKLLYLILFLSYSLEMQAQKSNITFGAGYSQTTASAYKPWAWANKTERSDVEIFNKPGFFVGAGLNRGKYDFEAIFVRNSMVTDTNSFITKGIGYNNNPTKKASLNYIQFSILRKINISRNLSFKYGLASNFNIYTQTTHKDKDYDRPGETLKWKTKGLTMTEGLTDFFDVPYIKKNINVVPVTLNFATRINYNIKSINVFFAYNIGLTKAVFDPSQTSFNFYYSNLNLGISTNLKKSKKTI